MKLVTQDYGCGTSASILDYGIQDVVIVSETNYEHVFEIEDDLLFIGHDFLFFLWDNEEKFKKWMLRKSKWEHWVWCFERIDAIIPVWLQKSHLSLSIATKFCTRILACDEDDCDKYGFDWLPQWASCKFYDNRNAAITSEKILFSGQLGKPEYAIRTSLINELLNNNDIGPRLNVSNTSRDFEWDAYIQNLLNHRIILNPVGVLKSLNTRAYETLYSGRLLLQQTVGKYRRHEKLLEDTTNAVFFENGFQLKSILDERSSFTLVEGAFEKHNLYERMKMIGISVK